MTIAQLETLNEAELGICLHVVNVIFPGDIPNVVYKPRNLLWFKKDHLIKKLLDAFQHLKPEGHADYSSLMMKLGVKVEIHQQPAPVVTEPIIVDMPPTSSIEPQLETTLSI